MDIKFKLNSMFLSFWESFFFGTKINAWSDYWLDGGVVGSILSLDIFLLFNSKMQNSIAFHDHNVLHVLT